MLEEPYIVRFWNYVDQRSGPKNCWPWTGSTNNRGYGQFWTKDAVTGERHLDKAHRVAYELAHGPIPDGQSVYHSCNNSLCCNPKHLYTVPPNEFAQRAWREQRYRTVLSEAEVSEIRTAYQTRGDGRKLAHRYGVTISTIYLVARGFTHRWNKTPPTRAKYRYRLQPAELAELLALYATGNYMQKDLAAKYKISYAYVSLLVNGKRRIPKEVLNDATGCA